MGSLGHSDDLSPVDTRDPGLSIGPAQEPMSSSGSSTQMLKLPGDHLFRCVTCLQRWNDRPPLSSAWDLSPQPAGRTDAPITSRPRAQTVRSKSSELQASVRPSCACRGSGFAQEVAVLKELLGLLGFDGSEARRQFDLILQFAWSRTHCTAPSDPHSSLKSRVAQAHHHHSD